MNQIDFLASQPHYLDHIAPVWDALPDQARGTFYVPEEMLDYADRILHKTLYLFSYTDRTFGPFVDRHPVLVAGYGDMMALHRQNPSRRIVMMEHGTGHTFHTAAYPDGTGKRDWVDLFLPPNEYTKRKIQGIRQTRCEVVGTPKLDKVFWEMNPSNSIKNYYDNPPTIAIGFHWGSKNNIPPESGTAFDHYKGIIPELSKQFNLLGYGHPLAADVYKRFFTSLGIEYTNNLMDVFHQADVCINDLSSAMYEFLVTGKPVIVLNAPWFRRDVQHGIRFWDYADIGIQVEEPGELVFAIQQTLDNYGTIRSSERVTTVQDLFPYLGIASERAAGVLRRYLE